ncbi:MAG: hypothetical protein HY326_05605 [Chloroflexi bacterium]|nr:hypothetical protein [Chloroflexota bacterium]
MKISMFTGIADDPERLKVVNDAVTIAAEHLTDMIVLPGYSFGRGCPPPSSIPQQLADNSGISILAELDHTYYFRPNEPRVGPLVQRFVSSKDVTRSEVQQVVSEFNQGKRVVEIKGKRIGILLCGENNILRNIRKEDYRAGPRYPDIGWPFEYDILVNPSHTSMGEWHLLHKRFAYFSRSRVFLFCTNNTHKTWKTSLCIYRDGEELLMGDFEKNDKFLKHIEENWRLITIEL